MVLGLLANFNNSVEYSFFYKLTSQNPYPIDFRLLTPPVISLNTQPSAYKIDFYVNNTLVLNQITIDPLSSFYSLNLNRTLPTLSGFRVDVFTTNNNFLTSFLLSAKFVPYFLSADFIGFPGSYFTNPAGTLKTLNYNDFVFTPGMFFFGEGHQETIYLSGINVSQQATDYIWRINNSTTEYPIQVSTSQPYTSAAVTLTSDIGTDLRLPVSLHVINSDFASTDPTYYRDDVTSLPVYYPYYVTTVDIKGNELSTNTRKRQSIQIKPYNPIEFAFKPGLGRTINLPVNESQIQYEATFQTAVEGLGVLSPCYDKYGLSWRWSTFENCSAIDITQQTSVATPSSWGTVECSGNFPKIWRNLTLDEIDNGLLSAEPFSVNPITCSATPVVWTLSTINWNITGFGETIGELISKTAFPYSLNLKDFGFDEYTVSFFNDTNITLNVQQTFTCLACVTDFNQAPGYIQDWKPKDYTINISHDFISIAPSKFKIYTPNRFVLTGTEVKFQNLITNITLLTGLKIDFDDNKVIFLTGQDIRNSYFNISYDTIGFKTLTVEGFTRGGFSLPIQKFPNIVRVLTEYDEISPTEYRTQFAFLNLPWKNKPIVGPNDWVTEDNFNSAIIKFYENLEYLETRGREYDTENNNYFGYLGIQPIVQTTLLTGCEVWTWEDLDCLNTSLPYFVTWRDVLSGETVFDNGKFVECGTWNDQKCLERSINPTCFGRYDIQWQWKALKERNSLRLVTWKDARCAGELAKRWLFEPSTNTFLIPCDEGLWNVNIPGIDEYYETIAIPTVQSRCIYYGVASKNNKLYLAQKTQIKLLSSDYNAFYFSYLDKINEVNSFSNIKNVCVNSEDYIYVLDNVLNQVAVYTYETLTVGSDWRLLVQWGGFGTASSPNKFSNPNDLHIDQLDNVWVCDTGNGCVKTYSDLGNWIRTITDEQLKLTPPLSLCVDSQKHVHILTNKNIRVYSYIGEFLFEYDYKLNTNTEPRKINSSFNREVIYLACESQVVKYFRNGVFFGTIVDNKERVNNINGIYHDEFRNLLILTNDKILKYPDLMTLIRYKGVLPSNFWSLKDLLIHEEEYVQNWVYTKSLQRLWDNIEIFRNTLFYDVKTDCKKYIPPLHGKEKVIIGQNELVTSSVVNRALSYLWDNFFTLVQHFDPNCQESFKP